MAVIRPFNALRPNVEAAPKVASVPYDVVNKDEAAVLADSNPLSFLRVTRSEIDLEDNIDAYSPEVYKKAKENLEKLKSKAPLIEESSPRLYLYKLEMNGRAQVGVAATFSVDDYDNDIVLKHEKTRKVKEDDRTNHIVTTGAQTGPVFLTYKDVAAVNNIVNRTMNENEPVYAFTSEDNIKHSVWVVPENYTKLIVDEIEKVKNLYIADGHHRAASASRARKEKQNSNPAHTGDEEYNYFIGVLFPASQLKILPYNRVVFSLNGKSKDEFMDEVSEKFEIHPTEIKEPMEKLSYGLYIDGKWYQLKARDSVKASNSLSTSVGDKLDVSILQNFLLHPILGIEDPRTDKNIDFIGGIRGTKELEKLVDNGKAAAAFSLYPVSIDDLINISDAGEVMPPKSTWFEPKLRDGLLVHLI